MNVELLNQTKLAILAEPDLYDQDNPPMTGDACDTPCCIFGWLCWIHDPKTFQEKSCAQMADIAGMGREQFSRLYVAASGWPDPFRSQYKKARTPKERALVAAKRIEHFIATEGRE